MKKKLAKKKAPAVAGEQLIGTSQLRDSAALFAKECWRIKKLLPEFRDNRKALVLTSSVEKMIAALSAIGIEIDDPEQNEFRDGMTLKVALFQEAPSLSAGKKVITETLEPAIYLNNQLVEQAKVIVSVGTGSE
ncbi:MAG: hypothetical protein ACE14L_01055 [Terriglobales bacterium]